MDELKAEISVSKHVANFVYGDFNAQLQVRLKEEWYAKWQKQHILQGHVLVTNAV